MVTFAVVCYRPRLKIVGLVLVLEGVLQWKPVPSCYHLNLCNMIGGHKTFVGSKDKQHQNLKSDYRPNH